MNLRDLKYLVAVAETGHFGRAAEACHVSQPTLSMQLKKLEETLGAPLIERGKRQAMLTPTGVLIAEKAREILQLSEQMHTLTRDRSDPLGGELRLGAFPTLAPYLFPLIVPAIAKKLPKLSLLLVEEKTATLLEQLKKGTLDAALIATPVEEPGIVATPLFSEEFLLAAPARHPLAKLPQVRPVELAPYPLLLLDEGHCLRDQALDLCQRVGVQELKHFRATSLETLRQMVISSGAITLIPKLAQRPDPGIAYIPFMHQTFTRQIALCTRAGYPRRELMQRLASLIQQESELYMGHGAK